MPTLFHITPASTTVSLDSSRKGRATFTVTNASGLQMHARANVVAPDPNTRGWFRLAEDPEHSFGAGDTTQYTVQIDVPARAPAGRVSFRLDVVGVENPDEDYTEGPPVQVVVPETPEESRPFPWWILAVAGGVLLIGIILAIVLWPRQATVPYVRGLPEAAAWATIQAARLEPVVDEVPNPAPIGQAIATTPEAETRLKRGSEVNLIVSAGQTATPTPTATATPEPTPTDEPTPTPTIVVSEECLSVDLENMDRFSIKGRGFALVPGSFSLFFRAEEELERMVKVLEQYGITERCFVGLDASDITESIESQRYSMEYYLVKGQAPEGSLENEDCIRFDPTGLRVAQSGGNWVIRGGLLLDFGSRQEEAARALKIIQKYGFTHQCFVGRPNKPTYTYYRR